MVESTGAGVSQIRLRALREAHARLAHLARESDGDAVTIAAQAAASAVYDLVEWVRVAVDLPQRPIAEMDQYLSARGGEVGAALSAARGAFTHPPMVERMSEVSGPGYGLGAYGQEPYGDPWVWIEHQWTGSLARRGAWYAEHVAGRVVEEPVGRALVWFESWRL